MTDALAAEFGLVEREYDALQKARLSQRKALLVVALLDNFADRAFAELWAANRAGLGGAEDSLAYRRQLRAASPAMGMIFDLCVMADAGPRLATHAIEVPIADYPQLAVEDFMVSLYNQNTVQRVFFVWPDGREAPALDVLGAAIAWWRANWPE